MSKSKYSPDGGLKEATGKKGRENYNKSGKLAARKEKRREEAIERQTKRVAEFEKKLARAKKKAEAQAKLDHAQLTLLKVAGGRPQSEMEKQFKKAPAVEPAAA